MNTLGWIGDALLVGGIWFLSEKKRWAFLVSAVGSVVWGVNGYTSGMWDLVALNIVFIAINIKGFVGWKKEPPKHRVGHRSLEEREKHICGDPSFDVFTCRGCHPEVPKLSKQRNNYGITE